MENAKNHHALMAKKMDLKQMWIVVVVASVAQTNHAPLGKIAVTENARMVCVLKLLAQME